MVCGSIRVGGGSNGNGGECDCGLSTTVHHPNDDGNRDRRQLQRLVFILVDERVEWRPAWRDSHIGHGPWRPWRWHFSIIWHVVVCGLCCLLWVADAHLAWGNGSDVYLKNLPCSHLVVRTDNKFFCQSQELCRL